LTQLALAYAVSIAEERHPAANDFEKNDHFRVVKLKRENVKTPQRENFALRELHAVHNAKAFLCIHIK
jgi:hypothetical protein